MNEDVAKILLRTRAQLLINMPFFGQLALRLKLVEDPSIPTLATNGYLVKYNPQFIEGLPPDQRRTAIAHEVGHCIFAHIGRRGARNPQKWNIAGDHVINLMLEEAAWRRFPAIGMPTRPTRA
jgi:predicted metal-dependent peptidase